MKWRIPDSNLASLIGSRQKGVQRGVLTHSTFFLGGYPSAVVVQKIVGCVNLFFTLFSTIRNFFNYIHFFKILRLRCPSVIF